MFGQRKPSRLVVLVSYTLIILMGCFRERHLGIMSWEEYSQLSVAWPILVRIKASRGELLYFGAKHTNDPANPQGSEIERLWREFRPDVAFNEGGDPPVEKSLVEAVTKYGESGLVRFLAARDGVPVQSIDPTRAEEVAVLVKRSPSEKVKLFYVLRAVAQHQRFQPGHMVEEELRRVFPILAATPGLQGPPNSIAELQSIYTRTFPGKKDLRDVQDSWFDPMVSENFLNEISRQSSEYRNRYMVDLLTRSVNRGKRVFAVVGGTHVVMQERAIRAGLN